MAETGYVLSQEAFDVVMEAVRLLRTTVRNTRNRPEVPREPITAPDVYIAKTPPNTPIPAKSGTTVSSVECNIWRIINGQLLQLSGLTRAIYNLNPVAIPADTEFPVMRDKPGQWLAMHPFADAGDEDSGTATSTETGCDTVTMTEQDVRCESGVLNVYARTIWLDIVEGCLVKHTGSWTFLRAEGCCECEETTGTGTQVPCECTIYPGFWTSTITGFATECASFNGQWYLASVDGCTYTGTLSTATATLVIESYPSFNTYRLYLDDGSDHAVYFKEVPSRNCCASVRLSRISSTCTTYPSFITVVPNCDGGTATATEVLGTATELSGTGTAGQGTGTDLSGDCCAGMPTSLTATITAVLGGTCINTTATISFNASQNRYEGTGVITCPGLGTMYIVMACVTVPSIEWRISLSCAGFIAPLTACDPGFSCDPFSATFNVVFPQDCGSAFQATVVVTE